MFSNSLSKSSGIALVTLVGGCSSETAEERPPAHVWTVSSPAFATGAEIPADHTCSGKPFAVGANPELNWTDGPAGTKSYAIVVKHLAIVESVDPSSPDYAKGFMWVIWDIPSTVRKLPANLGREQFPAAIPGAQQWAIRNQFGYFAPCPNADPASATPVTDRYSFSVYALGSEKVALPAKEETVNNYTLTITKHLDTVKIGLSELHAVSSAVSSEAPTPVDPATLVFPAGTVP
jgi:phosphatidylethanolamine-binding protein (PEBP) family uncharacterized protein